MGGLGTLGLPGRVFAPDTGGRPQPGRQLFFGRVRRARYTRSVGPRRRSAWRITVRPCAETAERTLPGGLHSVSTPDARHPPVKWRSPVKYRLIEVQPDLSAVPVSVRYEGWRAAGGA